MTPTDTAILAAYFFILCILAMYGWHRYYLVWVYMKHKDNVPKPRPHLDPLPVVTIQLPIYNEMYVVNRLVEATIQMDYPKDLLEIQVLDDSTDETRAIAELAVRRCRRAGLRHQVSAPRRPHRLQGRRARSRPQGRARRVRRHLRRRLRAARGLPAAHAAAVRRTEGRHGAGALGPHQSRLLAADAHPVDHARRPLRPRARRPQPRRRVLQLQRHRRHLAPRGDHRRGRLAARYADRGPRPQLPRAAQGLEVRVHARPRLAGRSAGRDERLQVAAAPLGQGLDPDLPQAPAAHPVGRTCRCTSRPRRSSTSPPTSTIC